MRIHEKWTYRIDVDLKVCWGSRETVKKRVAWKERKKNAKSRIGNDAAAFPSFLSKCGYHRYLSCAENFFLLYFVILMSLSMLYIYNDCFRTFMLIISSHMLTNLNKDTNLPNLHTVQEISILMAVLQMRYSISTILCWIDFFFFKFFVAAIVVFVFVITTFIWSKLSIFWLFNKRTMGIMILCAIP